MTPGGHSGELKPAFKKVMGTTGKVIGAGLRGYLKGTDALAKKLTPLANKLPKLRPARPMRHRGVK
jgi:hypothetical protein